MNKILRYFKKYSLTLIITGVGGAIIAPFLYLLIRFNCPHIYCWLCISPGSWMTCFTYWITAITLGVVLYQVLQIKKQIQLQTLIDLGKEWDGEWMAECRRESCKLLQKNKDYFNELKNHHNDIKKDQLIPEELAYIETVLEFFEKVSALVEDGTLEIDAVWEILGWYLVRYYHYFEYLIKKVLWTYWTKSKDRTLYENFEKVYNNLIKIESEKRQHIGVEIIKKEFDQTQEKFIKQERIGKDEKNK